MSRVPKGHKVISTGYEPRPLQKELHLKVKRFSVLVMHRRFGKTVFALNHTINKALKNQNRMPQYAYLAPYRDQAKRVAWNYLKQYTEQLPNVEVNEAELRVDIPRPNAKDHVRFMLLGADNPKSLKGLYLDGVIKDEYAEMFPNVWTEVIRPTLSDRRGWAMFIGTPKGRNNFYELYNYAMTSGDPEWFAALYKASETGIIPKEELDSARRTMTQEEYEQEYECSFQAGLVGAYFSREISDCEKESRITNVPYDPVIPVDTYWDLGINDTSAVWFVQATRGDYRVVDYHEEADSNIPSLVNVVNKKIHAFKCKVGSFNLPHDVKVRELSSGKSRLQVFRSLGCKVNVVPKVEDKLDSIHAARMVLPKCIFDAVRCKRGLDALMNYQRKWDSKSNVFSQRPLHNWASNGADAFQQFAMGAREYRDENNLNFPIKAETEWDLFDHR